MDGISLPWRRLPAEKQCHPLTPTSLCLSMLCSEIRGCVVGGQNYSLRMAVTACLRALPAAHCLTPPGRKLYFILYHNQDCWQTLRLTSPGICSLKKTYSVALLSLHPRVCWASRDRAFSPPPGDHTMVSGSAEQVSLVLKDKKLLSFAQKIPFLPCGENAPSLRGEGRVALSPPGKPSSFCPRFLVVGHDSRKQDAPHPADALCAN